MKCLVCRNKSLSVISEAIREGRRRVFRCRTCGFVFLDHADSVDYSQDYGSKIYDATWDLETCMEKRCQSLSRSIDMIRREINGRQKVLEIGSGVGACMLGLKRFAPELEIDAVEPNEQLRLHLQQRLGCTKTFSDVREARGPYSFVFGIHTFEHFPDPYAELEAIGRVLAPTGRLYLEFPNNEDYYAATLKNRELKAYRTFMYHNAHRYYYSPSSFALLVDKTDWQILELDTAQDYTVVNYFHWYLNGCPMANIAEATTGTPDLAKLNAAFLDVVERTGRGCTIRALLGIRQSENAAHNTHRQGGD